MQLNLVRVLVVALIFSLMVTGCAPRGESKSLDEVYQLAKARYSKVQNTETPEHVSPVLTKLVENLNAAGKNGQMDVTGVAGGLADLSNHASFTNRPAFAELAAQYRALSSSKDKANPAGIKLLASRTYSLLASELETAKFRL